MKRILIIIGAGITFLFPASLLALHICIGHSVKEKINIAKQRYQGTAEEALLSLLMDENNPAYTRTHTAIWTLGQIRSEKALPVLYEIYENDPEGKTCHGRHHSALCQYEIHKAIVAIENGKFFSYERLK